MSNKVLNLEPIRKLLSDEVSAEELADFFNEILFSHMRVMLCVAKESGDTTFIHSKIDNHIFYMKILIDALKETAELSANNNG